MALALGWSWLAVIKGLFTKDFGAVLLGPLLAAVTLASFTETLIGGYFELSGFIIVLATMKIWSGNESGATMTAPAHTRPGPMRWGVPVAAPLSAAPRKASRR